MTELQTRTKYTYDTDSTCGTSKGDLVKKVDQIGDTICYAYDSLHRMTSATYPSGSYASVTPSRYLVYDSATVNSVAMANAKARLAEAYTCFSPCSTKLTDLGQSYTARGEISDVYESTPNSGSYNHVNETYWANGGPDALSAQHGSGSITGFPTITYGVEGEGRMYSASASSGQNPLSSTTYNPASQPLVVTLGSSDSDTFAYDSNTDRMTSYTFDVNGQSVVGTLTWNAIATLQKLVITDPFNSGNAQTCTYTHDDLVRIASDNCGSSWSQTMTYDAFGNLNKSGTMSFQPTYSTSTNQMTAIGSSTPTYDSNGNVTDDFLHTYAWDANGRPRTIDGVSLTYDALGSMVEQDNSGTYSQIIYAPSGAKLAVMRGSTLQKAFVSLTGGSVAVYNSSGLDYYRHSDWLGSSRFASTPSGTNRMYYDGAYGPFGEAYAGSGTTDLSFTGMNQDTVTNLYDFSARETGTQGRWPSPDPSGLGAVDPTSPQSWDRYAYVIGNPLSYVDPLGLFKGKSGGVNDSTVTIYQPWFLSDCVWYACITTMGWNGGAQVGAPSTSNDPSSDAGDPGCQSSDPYSVCNGPANTFNMTSPSSQLNQYAQTEYDNWVNELAYENYLQQLAACKQNPDCDPTQIKNTAVTITFTFNTQETTIADEAGMIVSPSGEISWLSAAPGMMWVLTPTSQFQSWPTNTINGFTILGVRNTTTKDLH